MSGKRRSAGPIRQLSLQHPPSTATRRLLKKQQSMDAERLWTAGNSINGDMALRVTASSFRNSGHFPQDIVTTSKTPPGHAIPIRPRPVKLAWTDRRQQSLQQENQNQLSQNLNNNNNVEVVAKRFIGQPRASAAKSARQNASNLPAIGGDKDSILYTRQQLAERLRRAWKEREASRPNLDIFLAHNSIDNDADDEPSFLDNETEGAPDLRPESVLAASETLFHQTTPIVGGSSSTIQKNCSIEPKDLAMVKSQLPQNISSDLMYSSTAIGLSKNLTPQKNIGMSNKNNMTSKNFDKTVINDVDNVIFTASLGSCTRSQIMHTEVNISSEPSVNVQNTKNNLHEELVTEETSHKTAMKITNFSFSVFPRSSVIVIPKSSTNISTCANKTQENNADINSSKKVENKSSLLSQHIFHKDNNVKENLSENNIDHSVAKEKTVINHILNKSPQLEENIEDPKQEVTSKDITETVKRVIDVSAIIKEQQIAEPETTTISSNLQSPINNCKSDDKEREFNTNEEDEAKENTISSNSINSYVNMNNKEANNDLTTRTTPTTNKVPNTAEIMTATLRRVNFRNSINKAITRSFSSDVPPLTSDIASATTATVSSVKKPPTPKPTLSRALSAPSQRPSSKSTPVQQPVPTRSILVQRNRRPPLQQASSIDIPSESFVSTDAEGEEGHNQVRGERNIKSAPAKRRIKTAGPRRKSRGRGEGSSGDEAETGAKEEKKSSAPRVGRRGVARGAEIVTMVSLMSDGSDVDADPTDPFLQPAPGAGVAPWLEEKNKWMENPNKQTQNEQASGGVTPSPPRIVCLRKSPKSVTFQQQPSSPSNSTTASRTPSAFSISRRVVSVASTERENKTSSSATTYARQTSKDSTPQTADLTINYIKTATEVFTKSKGEPVLENAEVQQQKSSDQIPIQDCPSIIPSENIASSFTKKASLHKLISESTPKNEQEKVPSPCPDVINQEPPKAGHGVMVTGILKPEHTPTTTSADVQKPTADAEPEFQSPKERECWQLYRRMLEKGVSVSYDTVLRGMLTPTEYRLRRNALLSTTVRQLV